MAINSYRDLKVWQLSMRLVEDVYSLSARFPKQESFGLVSQVQRSAVSVPSNIAEGQARDSTKDYLRFISIALGSLAELETQLILSNRLTYITETNLTEILEITAEVGRMLRGLQKNLKTNLAPSP